MRKLFFCSLIALFSLFSLQAQQTKKMPINVGIYGGLNYNMHSVDMKDYSDTTKTYIFNSTANGLDLNLGLIGNYPIDEMFTLSLRLGYNGLGGGEFFESTNKISNKPKFSYLELSPAVMIYNLIPVENLYLLGGFEFGFRQSTEIEIDSLGTISTYDFDNVAENSRMAINLGVGYTYEISKNVFLSPEFSFRLPLSKIINLETKTSNSIGTWDIPQMRLGVNLTFGIFNGEDDKVVEKENAANLNVGFRNVSAIDKQGNRTDLSKVTLEEVQYTEQFPLIPYIFFLENSNNPDSTMQNPNSKATAGAFNIEEMSPDALEINHSLLDIIGTKMNADKNVSIKLVGTLDNKVEAKNAKLAKERAEYVKKYLVDNFEIDPSRITTEAGSTPVKPSSQRDIEGIAENRRVEIYISNNDSKLLEPITIQKDRQRLATPEIVEFEPFTESADSVDNWELEIYQADRLIRKFAGTGNPEKLQWSIMPNELTANNIPVDYQFKATTINGKAADAKSSVPVEYFSISRKKSEERPDRIISKYSLILFDFDSPEISQKDKDIMLSSIIPSIKFNSTVQVFGYSDRIGEETYNKTLALKRAGNIKDFLQSKVKDAKFEVFGVGEAVEIFNNDLPTGRQLSRTVQVYVITPKN